MATNAEQKPATFTVTVLTRHSKDCPKKDNPQWKRCSCRKSLYIYENGKVTYVSAKTRSWEQAEQRAQEERDARDPVALALREIEDRERAKETARVSLADALAQWVDGMKITARSTRLTYKVFVRRVLRWAETQGITFLPEVTPIMLDKWRSQWGLDAELEYNRIGPNTQAPLVTRLSRFFLWSHSMGLVEKNPAALLAKVKQENRQRWPLTDEQFDQVIAATYKFDEEQTKFTLEYKRGVFLRAIFQLQRWTGLRVSDCLLLPRKAIKGNRISTVTLKTGAQFDFVLPDHVVEAFATLPQFPHAHPDYFFWNGRSHHNRVQSQWSTKISRLNKWVTIIDDKGEPQRFSSHMLRDTFAIKMLLDKVPLEWVSHLLTHTSIVTTEKYYARWIPDRKKLVEDRAIEAMRRMGAVIS